MTFKRGKYRFKVARECAPAFRNALRILAEFGHDETIVNVRLGEIKSQVILGKCPDGATPVENRPGFYSLTVFTVRYIFSIDQEIMLIAIEDVDPSALTRILEQRAARRMATR
jgi:hypothetical protein